MECWNVGMLVFKGSFSFKKILTSLVNMHFINRMTLRLSTGNPLYYFPITQFSLRSRSYLGEVGRSIILCTRSAVLSPTPSGRVPGFHHSIILMAG